MLGLLEKQIFAIFEVVLLGNLPDRVQAVHEGGFGCKARSRATSRQTAKCGLNAFAKKQ